MSNTENSNKFLNNVGAKYSLDEIELTENNTTYNDSLHNNKITKNTNDKTQLKYQKQKEHNYYLALNSIQSKSNDTFQGLSLNEFSGINKINTKEKNIMTCINNPIIKDVIKVGNILKTIKIPKNKKPIITLRNQITYNIISRYNMVTEVGEKSSPILINENKNNKSISSQKNKNPKLNSSHTNSRNNKSGNMHNLNINISKDSNKNLNLNNEISDEKKNRIKDYKTISSLSYKSKNINKVKSNNFNIENNNMPYKLDIINDLEESCDINVEDFETKKSKNFSNLYSSNQMINQYYGLAPIKISNEKSNRNFNSRTIKSFDFRNLRKNNINYSIHETKHIKKWSNVDIILKNKNTKTTTGKKLRKKYERSELNSNKYNTNSFNQNNKMYYNNTSNNGLYIKEDVKYLTNEKLAKNLIGKFNLCSQGDSAIDNMLNNINENSKNIEHDEMDNELIDFLSNESGNFQQNINATSKEEQDNNDTFIIKTTTDNAIGLENVNTISENNKNKIMSENKQMKNSYNFNFSSNFNNMTKLNDNYNSPSKIRYFSLLPFDNNNTSNYLKNNKPKLMLDKNDNSLNKNPNSIYERNLSQNLNIIKKKDQDNNEFLNLSDSPSYINSQNQQIEEFPNINNIDNNFQQHTIYDLEFYQNLLLANNSYKKVNFQYIFKNQPLVNWEERLNTLLWMMKICEEFAFKRDTYHYSCFYFDMYLYLSKKKIKNKNEFKLIGITCISISAKIEEVQIPKLVEYADSIDDCYTIDDIIDIEKKICGALGWKLIPMTISSWLNWYTCQWDLFIYSIDGIKEKLLLFSDDENILFFKRQNEVSYYNYRRIYQIIDLIVLDYHSYRYDIRYLVASCFLILICLHYNLEYDLDRKILKNKKLIKKSKSVEKNDKGKILLEIYIQFIEQSFDFFFDDKQLNECILYAYKFINFKFSYDIPLIFQIEQDHINDYSYEDFISYQTTCGNIFPFFKELYKKEKKKIIGKKPIKLNKNLPINKNNKCQNSTSNNNTMKTMKTKKSFSSRKSSLTKDNSKNKISNL